MKRVIIILIVLGILAIGVLAYFMIYSEKCENLECFNKNLETCSQTSFIYEAGDASWSYDILGKNNRNCEINVKILQLKKGNVDISSLEGTEMVCSQKLGIIDLPQNNLENCHGILKEEMQKIIINRLHNYIVDNLGEIAKELENSSLGV